MNRLSFGVNTTVLNVRKIFWFLVLFEAVTLGVVWYIDFAYNINFLYYYIGVLLVPFLLIIVPIEPTIGILILVITTGLDILGIISKATTAESEYRLTYFHLALLLVIISTFLNVILKRKTKIPSLDLWPPLVAFTTMYAVSLIYTPDFFNGTFQFVRYLALSFICLIVIICIDSRWKLTAVVWFMLITPAAISILTMYQFYTQGAIFAPIVIKMATVLGLPVYRSTGTFSSPNKLACFLMIGVVIPFGLLFMKKLLPVIKIALVFFLVVSSVALAATFSRGGWVSTFFGLAVIVYFHRKWSYFYYFITFIVLIILGISVFIPEVWELVFDRFGSIFNPLEDASSSARVSLMRTGIWMWQDHPILGVGLRGFPALYDLYIDPEMPHVLADVKEAHTMQTEILSEQGLVGLTLATWLFFTIILHGYRTIKSMENIYLRNLQITFLGLFFGFIANFTFSSDINNNSFWVTLGMLYAIPLVEKYTVSEENRELSEVFLKP